MTIGFIEEWDIGQEKFTGLSAFFRCSGPLLADARMQDLLERALLFAVGEDYRPKCGAIQIPAGRKNLSAELLAQPDAHLRILVDPEFVAGKLSTSFMERFLARPNPASGRLAEAV